MKIASAEFVISNSSVSGCPKDYLPEYAFIGRSNVGKSSLINMLTHRKDLAKTSSRPGKTQLINHFIINKNWYLVDLPGYGYAKVSKEAKNVFQKFITDYFNFREQLVCAFVLIDIRHEPQKIDLEFLTYLGENQIPFAIVFTKSDKLGKVKAQQNITAYQNHLLSTAWDELPPYFVTSSLNSSGKDELLNYIDQLNDSIFKS